MAKKLFALDWRVYAMFEGFCKIASAVCQKFIGDRMHTFGLGTAISTIVGAVQFVGSALLVLATVPKGKRKEALVPNPTGLAYLIGAGTGIAIFGTLLSIYTFALEAELGPRTLIVNSVMVWSAIAGRLIWRDPLGMRQVGGIVLYCGAAWGMIDFMPLDLFLTLPWWFFVSLAVALGNAFNYVCLRKAKDHGVGEPFVQNFWIGLMTALTCGALFLVFLAAGEESVRGMTAEVAELSVLLGVIAIGVIAFIALANVGGASTGLQNAIMQAVYLIGMWLIGMVWFNDPYTDERLMGALLFFPAVYLMAGAKKK